MSKRGIHNQPAEPVRRRSRWWIFLWLVLIFLTLLTLIAWYVWANRQALVEDQIKNRLAELGYEIELTVTQLEDKQAQLKNVVLSRDNVRILTAKTLNIDYAWRDALEGRFKKITADGINASVSIDENGQLSLPFETSGRTGDGEGFIFPPKGIVITNSQMDLISPFGTVTSVVNGTMQSTDTFNAGIEIMPANIKYGDVSFDVLGKVQVDYTQGRNHAVFELSVPKWTYKKMRGEVLSLSGEGAYRLEEDAFYLEGPLSTKLGFFEGAAVEIENTTLNWDGAIGMTRGDGNILLADGEWETSVDAFSITRKEDKREIAETLSLYKSLSRTPVTEDFAEPLTRSIGRLFDRATIDGKGRIHKAPQSMTISLHGPLNWRTSSQSAVLQPNLDGPVLLFNRPEQSMRLLINASLDGPYPMYFNGSRLELVSTNGRNIKGTKSFEGQITLPKVWVAQTGEARPVRLAPTSAKVNFGGPQNRRRLILSGQLDFDGNIPGGYVEGLKTSGYFTGDLGVTSRLYFQPDEARPITIDRFLSDIPWEARNIKFLLESGEKPNFTLGNDEGSLSAQVSALSMELENLEQTRALSIAFGQALIDAKIGTSQSWQIDGVDIQMTSDNMPSEGTVMSANRADITAFLDENGKTEFTIDTPSASVKTEAVNARGLSVQVAGQPEAFRVNYQNGDISFTATDFPPFKMDGYVDYNDDNWFGAADSYLPFDGVTPLNVDYRFVDSRGYADVDIPEIYFTPRGLQPQMLIPILKGKISSVEGAAKVNMQLEFADGEELKSSGSARLIDMSMGTMPGPMSGINTELKFASFFPLVSEGRQFVTIDEFDPGFPLKDGIVEFEAIPGGFEIQKAQWPLGRGSVALNPTEWRYDRDINRVELNVINVELEDLFSDLGGENFFVSGTVNGRMPIKVDGLNVEVENGTIGVKDGGVIKFSSAQTDLAADVNAYAGYAFDSLKEFKYEELEATFNGPLDGLIVLRLVFQGSNPDVLYGIPFKFNVRIEGELLNIIRNFQLGTMIAEEVKKAITN